MTEFILPYQGLKPEATLCAIRIYPETKVIVVCQLEDHAHVIHTCKTLAQFMATRFGFDPDQMTFVERSITTSGEFVAELVQFDTVNSTPFLSPSWRLLTEDAYNEILQQATMANSVKIFSPEAIAALPK